MTRFLICGLLIGLVGCSSNSLDRQQARKNLQSQADDIRQAMLKDDHRKMANLTHPSLVEKMGGADKFVQQLAAMAAEMKSQGFAFQEITFSEPSELVEESGEVFAILPCRLEMKTPGGITGVQPSYLVCVSGDKGKTWNFVDGNGVAGDREKLKQLLPNFPSSLRLPAKEKPILQKP